MANTSVFISYRRADSAASTGRIADRLQQRFGDERIFHDVDSIELGVNFKKVIEEWLDKTDVFLVVIGDGWLEAQDAEGKRRLDDPTDLVRIEVAAALARGEAYPVIPVLVGSASGPPAESELPEDLRSLATRNSIVMRSDAHFEGSMDRLIKYIEAKSEERRTGLVAVPPEPEPQSGTAEAQRRQAPPEPVPSRGWGRRLGIGAALLLVAALVVYNLDSGGDDEYLESDSENPPVAAAGNVYVPDFYGAPFLKARDQLLAAGFDTEADYSLLPGQSEDDFFVERTEPPAGSNVPRGSNVTLVLKHIDSWEVTE